MPMSHEAQGVTGDIDEEALSGYLGLHTVFYVPPVDSPEGERMVKSKLPENQPQSAAE